MRECARQPQAEVLSKSRSNIHQSWGPPFSRALYSSQTFAFPEAVTMSWYFGWQFVWAGPSAMEGRRGVCLPDMHGEEAILLAQVVQSIFMPSQEGWKKAWFQEVLLQRERVDDLIDNATIGAGCTSVCVVCNCLCIIYNHYFLLTEYKNAIISQ